MRTPFLRTPQSNTRRGLTLIELVVVMVILAALAGILIPNLTGMTTRAHASTSATNAGEITKAVQTYQVQYLGYPNNLDSLLTNISSGTLATYMPSGGTDVTTTTLATADGTLAALTHAGITSVTQMVESTAGASSGTYAWSATFYPYAAPLTGSTPLTTTLADGNKLLGLNGLAAAREFGAPATAKYVMLGVGKYSTLNRVMQEAPVHFDDDSSGSPAVSYARYLTVFQVTEADGTTGLEKAKLLGVVALHDDGVSGVSSHLAEYWAANK